MKPLVVSVTPPLDRYVFRKGCFSDTVGILQRSDSRVVQTRSELYPLENPNGPREATRRSVLLVTRLGKRTPLETSGFTHTHTSLRDSRLLMYLFQDPSIQGNLDDALQWIYIAYVHWCKTHALKPTPHRFSMSLLGLSPARGYPSLSSEVKACILDERYSRELCPPPLDSYRVKHMG
jgi:hypothetical protein